ncbi:MAG: hypothetical protein CVV02_01715 [Firmicutes bacterium HGW-Firmicutes-7]|nr:MAG: hypothetical protein CVV02_01715 [Firmicutes bacterium HGW-Firmicutes-7]
MNIKDILGFGGYEVLEDNIIKNARADWTHKYKVKFTPEKKAIMNKEIEEGESFYDYDLNDTWTIIVTDVGFNGLGDLWISIAIDHDLTECWDLIEYENKVSNTNFSFNEDTRKYEIDGLPISCGAHISVLYHGEWVNGHIEYNSNWDTGYYLVVMDSHGCDTGSIPLWDIEFAKVGHRDLEQNDDWEIEI